MDEYIEREALYEKAYWHGEHPDVGNPFPDGVDAIDIEDVDAIPAADVVPVRHARWENGFIDTGDGPMPERAYLCSQCGKAQWRKSRYCPNCGAKMDLEG